MEYKKFQVSLFGRQHTFDWNFEVKKVESALLLLKEVFTKDIILDTTDIHLFLLPYAVESCSIYQYDILDFVREKHGIQEVKYMDWLLQISEEDTEWRDKRNEGLTGVYYHKVRFPDWFIQDISDECDRLIVEIREKHEASLAEQKAMEDAAKAEKEQLLKDVEWTTTEKTIEDEDGRVPMYTYDISYRGKVYQLRDRNVFDFGRVINYQDGIIGFRDGQYVLEKFKDKSGWEAFPMTEDEQHIAKIVCKYGCYAHSDVRM